MTVKEFIISDIRCFVGDALYFVDVNYYLSMLLIISQFILSSYIEITWSDFIRLLHLDSF